MNPTVVPILPSPDADPTSAFYSGIGFEEVTRFPNEYLILGHPPGIERHFFKRDKIDPRSNGHGCYVRFDSAFEARAQHDTWSEIGAGEGVLHPRCAASYDLLEFALLDQCRNLLRIGGAVPE